jgi:hypothetical protein
VSLQHYDNTLPLFLGGPLNGQIRLVKAGTELLGFRDDVTLEGVSYQVWTLSAGGRHWVFYRILGMSGADALGALVGLAAAWDESKPFSGSSGSVKNQENKQTKDNKTAMWKKVIDVLRNALELAKADPADKQQIRRLIQANADLAQELAAAKAKTPSDEDRSEMEALVDAFAAAVPAVEAETVVEPEISGTTGEGAIQPPATPYPGTEGGPVTPPAVPAESVAPQVPDVPSEATPEVPVEATTETPAPAETVAVETPAVE